MCISHVYGMCTARVQVRKAVHGNSRAPHYGEDTESGDFFKMGTVVSLVENSMFRRLWSDDFDVVACGRSWDDRPAWIHDIFLDCLASGLTVQDAASSFVLNPGYTSLLDEPQERIKAALQPLAALIDDEVVNTSKSFDRIEKLLKEFGEPSLLTSIPAEKYYSSQTTPGL